MCRIRTVKNHSYMKDCKLFREQNSLYAYPLCGGVLLEEWRISHHKSLTKKTHRLRKNN